MYNRELNQPRFETAMGVFRVILPNCNEQTAMVVREIPSYHVEKVVEKKHIDYKSEIMKYVERNGKITRKDAQELLGLKQTRAFEILKQLCESNELHTVGVGRSSYYEKVR